MHNPPLLTALAPSPFASIQDGGRQGWRRFGVAGAGAMDPHSLAAANALVGNLADTAALEFAFTGGTWRVDAAACRLAVAGGTFDIFVEGARVPPWRSFTVRDGAHIEIRGARDAIWGYLAVAGGFAVQPVFGSPSTHRGTRIGGLHGRAFEAADALPLELPEPPPDAELGFATPPVRETAPLRAVPGPQDDKFLPEAIERFFNAPFGVTVRSDRTGYCLQGPTLQHAGTPDIVSDGVVPGCVQVPGHGQPIVLMRDSASIGGYAKIAAVISPDLGNLAQARPGQSVRFRQVSPAEANLARREFEAAIDRLPDTMITMPG